MKFKQRVSAAKLSVLFIASGITANAMAADANITMEKIMSDPKWISNSPQRAKWLPNSSEITFQQKQDGTSVNSQKVIDLNGNVSNVGINELHKYQLAELTYNAQGTLASYRFSGDIFVYDINNNTTTQVTHTSQHESKPRFLNNGLLSYWQDKTVFTVDLNNRITKELITFKFAEKAKRPDVKDDVIATEQHKLIDYVGIKLKQKQDRFDHKQELTAGNAHTVNQAVYFDKDHSLVRAELSPKGDKLVVVTAKVVPSRAKDDLMPNYIGDDGRIKFDKVRRRVADAKPNQQQFWLVDVATQQASQLKVDVLPDFDKDVLAKVKQENAEAIGEKYQSKKSPRTINLMVDWSWSQSPIQWHSSGEQVAVMVEAWDNKDRWLATVDMNKKRFVNQHQLHDDAWINYTFNDFGWFNNSNKLYLLSEQSGYSHLYAKKLADRKWTKLTKGKFEVSTPVLSKDDSTFYFRANINHPGDYQVYSIPSKKSKRYAKPKALTKMKGDNNFELNFNEDTLLVKHSNLLTPTELYSVDIKSAKATRLTNTVSKEFSSMPWQKPDIVKVKSSHTDAPIYAKVYYPEGYKQGEKRRAVIFNHGAGYLQNSHFGWSGYFREFMFHNLLTQHGYVVMDMDYRASKGYGRDWRTAIYRQMGTPEIQDLEDGVNWLVDNANVDVNRIGTYGGSYGGFMTFMALFTKPDLFQAGAALRPVSDWAHYNDPYTSNILNRPQDDLIAYKRSSPIYFAEGLTKPLLINAPMIDNNVFFVDVVRLVQRFIELEKENYETAIYPVEPHGFVQPSSWLDEYRRIFKLFETHL